MKCAIRYAMIMFTAASISSSFAEEQEAVQDVARSLEQIAAEAKAILAKDKVHDAFDVYRKLKDFGMSYQPSLTAPNDLVGKLDEERLRLYAGVKLCDALYAVTFLKRQDVADCVAVIEEIQDALDLRSYADINNYFLHTLKKAAAQPEEVDIQKLIEQLASDYIQELPALLSSVESADYLIDGLYGFSIEFSYILGAMFSTSAAQQMEIGVEEISTIQATKLVLDLFSAFDRMDEKIRVSGETVEKLALIRSIYELELADESNSIPEEESNQLWATYALKINATRNFILTPDDAD